MKILVVLPHYILRKGSSVFPEDPIVRYFKTSISKKSSSFELFVVSIMQEDVCIGYTALALTLGLRVFS